MSYRATCPSCGAEIIFQHASSQLVVCDHCASAVARKGADIANLGKVAELIQTPTRLQMHIGGRDADYGSFRLVGRLQLDHGEGTWDEWYLAHDDGSWSWLAEAQGQYHLTRELPLLPPLPSFQQLVLGQTVDLGDAGIFVVTETKSANMKSAAGELPVEVAPGSTVNYADLQGAKQSFATIDYGDGDQPLAVYVGQGRALKQLGFDPGDLLDDAARRGQAEGTSLGCTQCGGPLEVCAPDQTKRIACPWCGSLLDVTDKYAVLEASIKVLFKPHLPIGSKGKLDGVTWTVIGAMQRSTQVDNNTYSWREYLLWEESEGYRWLSEANGHWSVITPLSAGEFRGWRGAKTANISRAYVWHGGVKYKHFQSSIASVDHVLGEFYWAVATGQKSEMHDYVAAPHMISVERSDHELHFTRGTYIAAEDVWIAFKVKGSPPTQHGVGPHESWPHLEDLRACWSAAIRAIAIAVVLFFAVLVLGGRTVLIQHVDIPPAATSASPEAAHFTSELNIRRGNVQIAVEAPVDNSWLYLDGALINESTGEVRTFDLEVARYHGRSGGSSWSEGSRRKNRFVASVPAGAYVMRLAPSWDASRPVRGYDLKVKNRIPRLRYLLAVLLLLAAWPIILSWRKMAFEQRRWSESDHPWGQG